MSVMDAVVISAFAFALVFSILVVLILLLRIISRFVAGIEKQMQNGKPAPAPVASPAPAAAAPVASAPASLKLTGVDEKTAAVLMAVVCHNSGIPLSQLRFNSIRAID